MVMVWLELCLFVSTLKFHIACSEWIDDISEIIELNRISLEHIQILVGVVFQIILISIDLHLLMTRYSIMLLEVVIEP